MLFVIFDEVYLLRERERVPSLAFPIIPLIKKHKLYIFFYYSPIKDCLLNQPENKFFFLLSSNRFQCIAIDTDTNSFRQCINMWMALISYFGIRLLLLSRSKRSQPSSSDNKLFICTRNWLSDWKSLFSDLKDRLSAVYKMKLCPQEKADEFCWQLFNGKLGAARLCYRYIKIVKQMELQIKLKKI